MDFYNDTKSQLNFCKIFKNVGAILTLAF